MANSLSLFPHLNDLSERLDRMLATVNNFPLMETLPTDVPAEALVDLAIAKVARLPASKPLHGHYVHFVPDNALLLECTEKEMFKFVRKHGGYGLILELGMYAGPVAEGMRRSTRELVSMVKYARRFPAGGIIPTKSDADRCVYLILRVMENIAIAHIEHSIREARELMKQEAA